MVEQRIKQDQLGSLTKVGQGGQGVVYRTPNVTTKFADSMVFKEYKVQARSGIDFSALAAMPALVEESLSYGDAEHLISLASWPCAMVENNSGTSGFVMPSIPERFFVPLTTVKGVSQTAAEYQHLLNEQSVLKARGITLDDAQRYALLREAASGLEFLHKIGVCVGDISPKNLLFSLAPGEAVYFIDCDAMRVNGVSAMPQVETPGWEIPAGEELATVYSDTYKLGLLALRLLVGDQETKNLQRIPSETPNFLRQIITDTLTNEPERRPLPAAWDYVLGQAVEEAQHRLATAPPQPPEAERPASEPVQVRARPKPNPAAAKAAAPILPASTANTSAPSTDKRWIVGGLAAAAVVLALILTLNVNFGGSDNSSSISTRRTTATSAYATGTSSESTVTATRTVTTQPTQSRVSLIAPSNMFNDADTYGDTSCRGGTSIPSGYRAARGSESTSCAFASSVGAAYMAANPDPVTSYQRIYASGTVPCPSVPTAVCSGNDFVMGCAVEGSDRWITCRGGREAVVYIF